MEANLSASYLLFPIFVLNILKHVYAISAIATMAGSSARYRSLITLERVANTIDKISVVKESASNPVLPLNIF